MGVSEIVPACALPQDGRVVLQPAVPLSASSLWELNARYFLARGPLAWEEVPDYVTTSTWNGKVQAELIFGFIQDLVAQGQLGATGTITVMELASGTGRLLFHVDRILQRLLAESSIPDVEVQLVLTDLVESNLDAARRQPWFVAQAEAGRVRFAAWDVCASDVPVSVDGPVVVLANYCFDGVPIDAYVAGKDLQSLTMGLSIPADGDPQDSRLLDHIAVDWQPAALPQDPPYAALLSHYAESVEGIFTVPATGLAFLDRIQALTTASLVIVADKGPRRLDEVAREDAPMIARHGSISMSVNLHAMAWWNEHRGGDSLSSWHPGEGLDTVVLAHGLQPRALKRSFHRWSDLDAGTYGTIWEMACAKPLETVGEALTLLRLCDHEPSGLERTVDKLEEAILAGEIDATTILGVLERVEATSYLPEPYDVNFDMGRLAYALEDWSLAAKYFARSADALPTSTPSWTNLAASAYQAGDEDTAYAAVIQAIAFDPEDNDALEVYSWFDED